MWSPIVDQNPGAVVQAASSPASARPATSPWASASPQCSTRRRRPARGVLGRGDVAHGEHGWVRAAHRGVDQHGAVLDVEAGAGGQLAAGRDAGPEQDEVGGELLAAGEANAPARLDALDLGAEAHLDARLAEQRGDELAGPLAQAVGLRKRLGRDERRVDPAPRERRRRLAGDEAGADDDRAGAPARPRRAARRASSTVRTVCRPGSSAPGTGGRCGAEPVASTQAS